MPCGSSFAKLLDNFVFWVSRSDAAFPEALPMEPLSCAIDPFAPCVFIPGPMSEPCPILLPMPIPPPDADPAPAGRPPPCCARAKLDRARTATNNLHFMVVPPQEVAARV